MTFDNYAIFDLLIQHFGENEYQARVLGSLAGQGQTATFALPFSQEELRRFFWRSGVAYRKLRLAGASAAPPLTPQQFGERLYAATFAGRVGECFVRSLDAAARDGCGLRICLRLNDVPELASLPWEYLYTTSPTPGFLALSTTTPIVRFPELALEEKPLRVTPPLRMLAVVSNPRDEDVRPLDVEKEYLRLEEALADLQSRGLLHLERLAPPTSAALQSRLRTGQAVHVLHFMGHGDFNEEAQAGGLYFENEAGAAHFLTADNLAVLLHDHGPLRLVFLNACEGARGGREDFFSGTAQTLMEQGIPAVVAMQFPVGDAAAIALAHEFYQALVLGMPVDACLGEARKQVKTAGDEFEWGTPVLFSRAGDGRVLVLPEADAFPQIAKKFEHEPETVLIHGGSFTLGSAPGEGVQADETPAHPVHLPDFRIGRTPVTNHQYLQFVRERGIAVAPEAGWVLAQRGQQPRPGTEDHPVVGVSWDEAQAYCRWLSDKTGRHYRLPSEAEWEKAASWEPATVRPTGDLGQAVGKRRFPWGDEWADGRCNASSTGPTPVGSFSPAGDSPAGCTDMAGNVWEWTSTWWGRERATADFRYPYRPDDGRERMEAPTGPYRELRICRGGSFRDPPVRLTCTTRTRAAADSRHATRGFRVVMALAAPG